MAQRTQLRRILTVAYAANQVVRTQLPISGKVRGLYLRMAGTDNVTVVGGASALARNPGTLVPSLTLYLNGQEVIKQGRWLDWVDRNGVFYKLPVENAVAAAVAADTFESYIYIPFQTPWGRFPTDTVLDMDAWDRLDLEVQWLNETALVSSAATQAFTVNPTIDVIAEISGWDGPPVGMYKELAFDSPALGAVANTDLQMRLVTGPRINYHHIILAAEDNPGAAGRTLVSTALNSIRLQQQGAGDLSNPIGIISGTQMQQEFDLRMRPLNAIRTGIYPMAFQPRYDGMATYNLQTDGIDDLRLIIDHAAFATAGTIRVMTGTVEPLPL